MRSSLLVVLAAMSPLALLAAQSGVRLTRVPERVVLPSAPGENLMLEVAVTGTPSAVWLARGAGHQARVPLAAAGGGVYQVNLADPGVLALLPEGLARGALRVCARFGEEVVESAGIGWVRAAPPPGSVQCLVVGDDGTVRRADPRWPRWLDAAVAGRIEVRGAGPGQAQVRARAGADPLEMPWHPDAGAFALELDAKAREVLQAAGQLVVEVRVGGETSVFVLDVVPARLAAADPPTFTVEQRRSAPIPGSRGWLEVRLGDITGGQVMLRIVDAEGAVVAAPRHVAERESVAFALAGERYALSVEKMVNRLFGGDHVELAVRPRSQFRPDPIAQLIRRVEAAEDVVFVREGREHRGPAAALLMRARLAAHKGPRPTPAEFVALCSASSRTGEPYHVRKPDGTELPARAWLEGLLAEIAATNARPAGGVGKEPGAGGRARKR